MPTDCVEGVECAFGSFFLLIGKDSQDVCAGLRVGYTRMFKC